MTEKKKNQRQELQRFQNQRNLWRKKKQYNENNPGISIACAPWAFEGKKKRKQRKFPKTRTDNLHYTATQFPKYNRERLIFM